MPDTITLCTTCGMRADPDPEFHQERYAHWPTVRGIDGENVPFIDGPIDDPYQDDAANYQDGPCGDH